MTSDTNPSTTTTPSTTASTVAEPSVQPSLYEPKFGFNDYAERLNGRAAMVGFVATLVIEYVSGQGLLSWLGLL